MRKAFVGEALIAIISLIVVLTVILYTAPSVANTGAMLTANTTAGGAGMNQSAPTRAVVPLISFLWIAMAVGAVLIGAMMFLIKK